ncbi:MAG: HAD family acid phosphatase [Opitutaceae bacterium]|nr:HAD family acid phosphatase [Opitutaceae bacterium]
MRTMVWVTAGLLVSLVATTGCATGAGRNPAPAHGATATAEPLNLSHAKDAVLAYVDEGHYARDLAAVAAEAQAWIERRAAERRPGERLAVVLDIDETVISNLPHMRAEDFGYNPRRWEEWVASANGPALPAMKTVYDAARAAGVDVLFLTGRKDPVDRAGTEENLRREGMADYAELKLLPENTGRRTALERKTEARAAWEAQGWTIIATIGDQASDLGAHAERGFKLPNPFYHIP